MTSTFDGLEVEVKEGTIRTSERKDVATLSTLIFVVSGGTINHSVEIDVNLEIVIHVHYRSCNITKHLVDTSLTSDHLRIVKVANNLIVGGFGSKVPPNSL